MKYVTLILGGLSYVLFLVSFLYLIGFLAGAGVPRHVDGGGCQVRPEEAIAVNLGLLLLFGLQHSVMARRNFKKIWTQCLPVSLERSIYVLSTVLVMALIFWQWRPLPEPIWSLQSNWGISFVWGLFGIGWLLILLSTFLINHFELFGLQQVWGHFRNRTAKPAKFHEPFLYRIVRHPLYVGWIVAFWATPHMTMGHLLFALGMTGYILAAIPLEERDLKATHPEYIGYAKRVPMLIPAITRRSTPRILLNEPGETPPGVPLVTRRPF